MPIHDSNGTSTGEIAQVHDHNGTVTTQMKEVYDWDGTTKSLILSSEESFTRVQTNLLAVVTDIDAGAYSAWTYICVSIPAGSRFHIDSVTLDQPIYTKVQVVGWVNNYETSVVDYKLTVGVGGERTLACSTDTYTAVGENSIVMQLHGKAINTSYSSSPTATLTLRYTVL